MKRIGILALQGAFEEHKKLLERLGAECFELRQKSDILNTSMDGLILPGGESTVMGKLLRELDMFELLHGRIIQGLPVFGTCAGLILLAKDIVNDPVTHFATMDISVKRNAYGRQLGSFYRDEEFVGIGFIPMTFIRAPYIEKVSGDVEVLARVEGKIVAARQKNMLVTAFHPELTDNCSVHEYFLNYV
ncbi:MAG: pyridoxal phosphate synthase yaaE subunit [Firmicutes bacterium]|nr:pyridoxal phosphate synthase yaaE subunit [Bacillota bacterium]